jgi:hypothetical protein
MPEIEDIEPLDLLETGDPVEPPDDSGAHQEEPEERES